MRTAGDLINNRVRPTLTDPLVDGEGITWTQQQLRDGLTMALTSLSAVKNDAYKVVRDIPLVPGYVQRLPSGELTGDIPAGLAVFEVLANVGGPAVTQVGRELLTASNKSWVNNTPNDKIIEWMADVRDRTLFFVNPPNTGAGAVTVMYGAIPQPILTDSDVIPVSDIWETGLWAFVVSYAYGQNTKRKDVVKEQYYLGIFNQMIGLRTASQVQTAPRLSQQEPV